MKVMIHAVPERMWYVRGFLLPDLLSQGVTEDEVSVWLDEEGKGNLAACMECFDALADEPGGAWHLQDDVLLSSRFAETARQYDGGDAVVYGFCCPQSDDDPGLTGTVYMPDAWHGFPCVYIPNAWAGACAAWYFSRQWTEAPELLPLVQANRGDDAVFHTFLELHHGRETAVNLKPNIAEHVDWLLGGSTMERWRPYLARSALWDEPGAVERLRARLKARKA
ncbi:MAG: hypothetical protein IJI97_10535 [Clostridia bacterium]|nr:hypothetical protein [Clostridia bacterium]